MNSPQQEKVDQALFGYSDGHRQIAASVRLPSKDQYQLAAATDLAAGARLNAGDSYLTGLPLAESRRFALIRTWLAPEMPRPGCVWSHVILIDLQTLSSHGDLSVFLPLLKRPEGPSSSLYNEPVSISSCDRIEITPDYDSIVELIGTYYLGEPVSLRSDVLPDNLEAAIMAVWSQQWPRLRFSFSFRTAIGDERRRSELINYDVQVGSAPKEAVVRDDGAQLSDRRSWIVAGAADAAATRITPLRRFLWRYGRDLSTPRKHYRTLVQLFLATKDAGEFPTEEALRIFEAIPDPGDGEILKRDILGIGAAAPALCPPLSLTGLMQFLSSGKLGGLPVEDDVRRRFDVIPTGQIGDVAMYVEDHEAALRQWAHDIEAGLIASADQEALTGELPDRTRRLILRSRPDLINRETIAPLSNDSLLELASAHHGDEIASTMAAAIVRRDFGPSNERLLRSMPAVMFRAAIEAFRSQELHSAWMQVLDDNSTTILESGWPSGVHSTADLATGLNLLRFPRSARRTPEFWLDALSSVQDDVLGEDRIRLHAFLLMSALQNTTPMSWNLVATVLPELRPVILLGELPADVYQTLERDLPRFNSAAYWDINKRILISLSRLRQTYADTESLRTLNLPEDDMSIVIDGAHDEEQYSRSRFWPWF